MNYKDNLILLLMCSVLVTVSILFIHIFFTYYGTCVTFFPCSIASVISLFVGVWSGLTTIFVFYHHLIINARMLIR